MEKSIEIIWKEGFLEINALIAPKVNNLYRKKSKHIVDKFKKMFKINLIAILVISFVILFGSIITDLLVMGVSFFLMLNIVVVINKKLMNGLDQIDKSKSSYEYLTAFDRWMKQQLSVNRKMARYYYPLFFLATVLGFWFSSGFQIFLNEDILSKPNEIYFLNGVPVLWLMGMLFVTCLLGFLGPWLYNLEVKIVYGRIYNKLDELILDIEELRK